MNSLLAPRRSEHRVEVAMLAVMIGLASGARCRAESPTAPSPPAAVASLALAPSTEQLAVGDVVDLRLEATLANGSVAIMSPVWGTDNPDVLVVKPLSTSRAGAALGDKAEVVDHYLRGQVTAQGPGVASVFADCAHGRGRQVIRVAAK